MNIAGQVPVSMNVQEPPARDLQLQWVDQQAAAAPAAQHHNWVIPALIGAALMVLAIVFWPREHAVLPTDPTTTAAPTPPAPANGYSDAEREADAAQARALAKIEELKRM